MTNKLPPMETTGYSVDVLVHYFDSEGKPAVASGYYSFVLSEWNVYHYDGECSTVNPSDVLGWWPMPTINDPSFTWTREATQ